MLGGWVMQDVRKATVDPDVGQTWREAPLRHLMLCLAQVPRPQFH